jgi:hypothetical protein
MARILPFTPMLIEECKSFESISYPIYIQRHLYGVRSFFKVDKFYFEKDLEIRPGEFLKTFEPLLPGLPGVIDGYFVYNQGATPGSEQLTRHILQNPGKSTEGLEFIAYDLFIPHAKTKPIYYEERLTILMDYCSRNRVPKFTTTMSAVAKSSEDLEKYKDLFFSRPIGKGIFIRPSNSVYYPAEVSKEVYYASSTSFFDDKEDRS